MKRTKTQLIEDVIEYSEKAKSLIQEINPDDITLDDFHRLEIALSFIQALINIANKSKS